MIGRRLRAARKALDLTLEAVAPEVPLSVSQLSRIESGKREARAHEVQRLADIYGISFSELMDGTLPNDDDAHSVVVPIVSWVSAGSFSREDLAQDVAGTMTINDLPRGDWIALRVEGDSMDRISPPGSIILVDRRDKKLILNGCYIIGDGNGNITYKRFRSSPIRFEPVSTNPVHEPIFTDGNQMPAIIGRVKKTMLDM